MKTNVTEAKHTSGNMTFAFQLRINMPKDISVIHRLSNIGHLYFDPKGRHEMIDIVSEC